MPAILVTQRHLAIIIAQTIFSRISLRRVLDKQDGKVLLLKDNSLGSTPFDETGKNVTWKSSSVRKWLNGDFLNDNFFKAEQNAILDTTVKNTANPVYNTPAGKRHYR